MAYLYKIKERSGTKIIFL